MAPTARVVFVGAPTSTVVYTTMGKSRQFTVGLAPVLARAVRDRYRSQMDPRDDDVAPVAMRWLQTKRGFRGQSKDIIRKLAIMCARREVEIK